MPGVSPTETQYQVLDELVARYGDDTVRAAILDSLGLDKSLCSPGSAADLLDMMTAANADETLDALSLEFSDGDGDD